MGDTSVQAKDLRPGDKIRIDNYTDENPIAFFTVLEVDFTTESGAVVLHVEPNDLGDDGLTSPPDWIYTVINRD